MKKIYMILAAVFALLSLSLNAQTKAAITVASSDFSSASWWTILSDNQGKTWSVSNGYGSYTYSSTYAANDWLVTPAIALQAGKTYTFNLDAWIESSLYPEKMEVKLASANTASALSSGTTIIAERTLTNESATTLSNTFTVTTDGNYYIGIHATSDADMDVLYVDDMSVTYENTDPLITASPTSVSMSAAPGGTVTQTVTVTSDNLTQGITATLSDNSVFSVNPTSLGTTGGTLTITYSPTAAGNHTATLTLTSPGADPVTITLNGTISYTIGDGTSSDYYLPAYGSYQDYGYKNQMIYTAAQLAEIGIQNGDKITSITFYPTTASGYNGGIDFYGSTVTLSLGNTNVSSFSGSKITPSDLTDMVTITPVRDNNATEWTFSWSTPFTYTGGNLLVQVYCPGYEKDGTNGDYGRTYFKGDNQNSNVGLYSYNSSASSTSGTSGTTGNNSTFQPQASFTFESSVPVHDLGITLSEPTAVLVGENATITATVTNNGNQTESGYTVTFSDGTNTFSTQTGGTLAPGATETFTATYTTSAAGTVTITANVACTGDADATNDEATATLTVTVPVRELTAPTNGETVDVGNNSGLGVSVTIPVSGNNLTQDVTVSVSGAGFTVSPTTLSAADVNAGTATVTITYNGTTSGTGTLTFSSSEFANVTVNLTGSYSTGIAPVVSGMVRMGTLRLVDQFAAEIPATNDHPYRYTYFLKLATRDTTSSPARVPAQHTGAEMQGYYTHAEMKGDTDPANFLEENIISAELDMNLSPASSPYFYTINSVKNGIPASVTADEHYESYLNVLQRREAGDYKERQGKYGYTDIVNPHMDSVYTAGAHDFFDYRKVVANDLGDFLSYVPIVWTKGIDRYYYTTDSLHNSYGAPIWNVTRGDVTVYQDGTVCQRQVGANGGWNASANYTVDGTDYSLYLVSLNAAGVLPKNSNVEYEPYMFRLWLHDETASLRNYTWMINNNWSTIEDAGAYTENDGKWKLLDTKMCENWGTVNGETTYHPDTTYVISINQGTSANPQSWQNNIGFVAPISGFTPELVVRFYYKIKGAPDPTASGLRGDGDDDNVGYVVVRGVNPDPGTAVREIVANGEIESQTYYNVQGMQSDKPFPGINIVVTRYSNGATTTTKVRY